MLLFFIATDELKYLVHNHIRSEAFPAAVLFHCGFSLSSNIKSFGTFISFISLMSLFQRHVARRNLPYQGLLRDPHTATTWPKILQLPCLLSYILP